MLARGNPAPRLSLTPGSHPGIRGAFPIRPHYISMDYIANTRGFESGGEASAR